MFSAGMQAELEQCRTGQRHAAPDVYEQTYLPWSVKVGDLGGTHTVSERNQGTRQFSYVSFVGC